MEGVPQELPCLVCPENVNMTQDKCLNCGELVSYIAAAWRQEHAAKRARDEEGTQGKDVMASAKSEARHVCASLKTFALQRKTGSLSRRHCQRALLFWKDKLVLGRKWQDVQASHLHRVV
jgi:hypothetical protein